MAFRLQRIDVQNPRPAGQDFVVAYEVLNDGADEPAHDDTIKMWGSNGSQPIDTVKTIGAVDAGFTYLAPIEVPPLAAGHYDVSITFPDGSGAGDTIVVA